MFVGNLAYSRCLKAGDCFKSKLHVLKGEAKNPQKHSLFEGPCLFFEVDRLFLDYFDWLQLPVSFGMLLRAEV